MKGLLKVLVGYSVVWLVANYYYHKGKVVAFEVASDAKGLQDMDVDELVDHFRDEELLNKLDITNQERRECLRIGRDVKKWSE